MENGPFMDDFPTKTCISKGFSMAMLNNQMVILFVADFTLQYGFCRVIAAQPSIPSAMHWGRWTASAFVEWSWPGGRCYMGQRCWHEACCWLDWWKMDSKTMGLTSRSKLFVQFFHSWNSGKKVGVDVMADWPQQLWIWVDIGAPLAQECLNSPKIKIKLFQHVNNTIEKMHTLFAHWCHQIRPLPIGDRCQFLADTEANCTPPSCKAWPVLDMKMFCPQFLGDYCGIHMGSLTFGFHKSTGKWQTIGRQLPCTTYCLPENHGGSRCQGLWS